MPVDVEAARGRLRRLNAVSQLAVLLPVGTFLVVFDAGTWQEAAVLIAGVAAALVAAVRWSTGGLSRVVVPCLAVSGAVWMIGAWATSNPTAFYGISVVGSLALPQVRGRRAVPTLALLAFVGAVGAARFLAPQDDVPRALLQYVAVPVGVIAFSAAMMYVNQLFYDLVDALEESRERGADLAVARERVRFAGDLHDIQGHTLHVVKLKTLLARKLVHTDPDRAAEELDEIHTLVGDTITQTKELAYAQRRLNLSAELENAKNLFEAAGIRVHVEREDEVDDRAGELLGQVLRETTTNILRHAQTREVRITLSAAGITIVNDGVRDAAPPELRGLATLRDRVADSGGELTVERRDGRFLTAATFPGAAPRTWKETR
ncbi:sensor histidine kinase [Actinomadura flavalba]|uniref:sensor histidine kinase n=1 Tax=Actinomadura flavalba TaxID=1120938 RepID=UPI0003680740|nr:histidine kinase [Actinomadura flavalba]